MIDETLRLRYMWFFILPYFIVLIYSDKTFNCVLFLAMLLIGISLNIHNNLCDREYKGYANRHLILLTLFSFLLGVLLYTNIILILMAIIVYSYNFRLKQIPIISTLTQTTIPLTPALILKEYDPLLLSALFLFGFGGQGMHELFDGETMCKVPYSSYLVGLTASLSGLFVILAFMPLNYLLSVPAAGLFFVGIFALYFRNDFKYGKKLHPREKDFWIILGNLITLFYVGMYMSL